MADTDRSKFVNRNHDNQNNDLNKGHPISEVRPKGEKEVYFAIGFIIQIVFKKTYQENIEILFLLFIFQMKKIIQTYDQISLPFAPVLYC